MKISPLRHQAGSTSAPGAGYYLSGQGGRAALLPSSPIVYTRRRSRRRRWGQVKRFPLRLLLALGVVPLAYAALAYGF